MMAVLKITPFAYIVEGRESSKGISTFQPLSRLIKSSWLGQLSTSPVGLEGAC